MAAISKTTPSCGQRVDVDADEGIGAGEVGEIDPRLELVAGADPAGLLEAGTAVAVDVAPRRTGAAEVGVVVTGQRHVGVADHEHADAVGLEPVAQPLGDRQGQGLLGQLDAALGRVRDAPVEAAAVAGVDGDDDGARVRLVDDAVRPRRRLDGPGRSLGTADGSTVAGAEAAARGSATAIGAAAGQRWRRAAPATADDAEAVRPPGAGSGQGRSEASTLFDSETRNSALSLVLPSRCMSSSMPSFGPSALEHPAHRPHHPQLVLVEQQLLAAGAGAQDVDGREDPPLG